MKLPMIDIQQVRGRIGIESVWGKLDVRTQPAKMTTKQRPAKITVDAPLPELEVDQSRAFAALHGGKILDIHSRIYSQIPHIALQNIARIVERGNRMAAIHDRGDNPIPDFAWEQFFQRGTGIEIRGPASFDNVDLHFTIHPVEVDVEVGGVDIEVETFKPEYHFERGKVHIYMEQYPSVTITPPVIDMKF